MTPDTALAQIDVVAYRALVRLGLAQDAAVAGELPGADLLALIKSDLEAIAGLASGKEAREQTIDRLRGGPLPEPRHADAEEHAPRPPAT